MATPAVQKITLPRSARRLLLHLKFRPKIGDVAIDRCDGEHAAPPLISQQAVPRRDVAVDRNLIPLLGMTDIIDRNVVVLAPEKRHRIECLTLSQHVARRRLALAFRDYPMLNADILL